MFAMPRAASRWSPIFTTVAVVTIAMGIGANTAILHSAVRAVALRPLGFADPTAWCGIWKQRAAQDHTVRGLGTELCIVARAGDRFDELAGWRSVSSTLTTGGEPQRMGSLEATASVLPLLGIRPLLGRNFLSEEDRPGGPKVAILFESLWRERFGADPALVGPSDPARWRSAPHRRHRARCGFPVEREGHGPARRRSRAARIVATT